MHYDASTAACLCTENLVVAAEGENKDVHVLPQRTWYLLSPLHMNESA